MGQDGLASSEPNVRTSRPHRKAPLMFLSRRQFVVALVAAAIGLCGVPSPAQPIDSIEASLTEGIAYLDSCQSADGTWPSDVYGTFKDGTALTPLVSVALQEANPAHEAASLSKSLDYLSGLVADDGQISAPSYGFDFPLYTSALSVVALSRSKEPAHLQARDAWLGYLRARQLHEANGWDEGDWPFGGWGYCRIVPRKPKPGEIPPPYLESNLSATLFALEALQAAGIRENDKIYLDSLLFVQECQNWRDDVDLRDPSFDDGGFHFIEGDPIRNKAGVAGVDRLGRQRYHSYGSATADGLRALRLCGLAEDHPRVIAAQTWLDEHFRADSHPGEYTEELSQNREAVYFYYTASVIHAMPKAETATALAKQLVARQRDDGSWRNPSDLVREDDPIVATCYALRALARCRAVLKDAQER